MVKVQRLFAKTNLKIPVCRTSCLKHKPERSSLFRVDRSGFYVILKIVLCQLGFQTLTDGFDKALAVHSGGGDALGQTAQVLGHDAVVQGLQTGGFQCFTELHQLGQVIQFAALLERAGPCKMVAMGLVEVFSPFRYL